jgi:hypothetical protein
MRIKLRGIKIPVIKGMSKTKTPYITLIQAPSIPTSEVKHLKAHWQEAERDPKYTVVLNYECRIDLVETPADAKVLVTAPGIPTDEVTLLKKQVANAKKATKQEDRLVVVNYECRIDTISTVTA